MKNNSGAKRAPIGRLLLLAGAGISLIIGLGAGLGLGGVLAAPLEIRSHPIDHGALMVFGFLGTVISLERAVAVRKPWAWIVPVLGLCGSVAMLLGLGLIPGIAWLGTFIGLLAIYISIQKRAATTAILVQMVGAVAGACAVLQWLLNHTFSQALAFAAIFLIATIIGERMELARVAFSGAQAEASIAVLVLCVFAAAVIPNGQRLLGFFLLLLALRSVQIDVARRLIRSTGLPRYSAWCMLLGYGWLCAAACAWMLDGPYDLRGHMIFLGFVFSMIFAHAPTIATAITKRPLPYSPVLYIPLIILHLSLAMRVISALAGITLSWQVAISVNVIAIVLFMACAICLSVFRGQHKEVRRATAAASTQ
ncbi:hypothetical protein [Corynebacterium pseudopelargi]|uniref:hypothetical protein n=1 Tax=Corynebacterium pseudopelargi TaxID=2080757 RepID=UPI000F4ECA6F|nr:hypothetical protein [Corynebacterium pseudopelargi]